MPDRSVDVLIVGAGVAGATCAETLRDEGFDGSILVVGRELDPPYHRPPATKELLRGEMERTAALLHPADFWGERGIELATRTSVTALDLQARVATLQGAGEVAFDRALLATGAMVRRLRLPGADLEGIHYVRALGNAASIRRDLEGVERAVMVGGSYIGCEVAASLTALGVRCTIVMQERVTLEASAGPGIGRRYQDALEAHGVEVVGESVVERFDGEGRVRDVVLRDGHRLRAELVVIGAGVTPDVMLAQRAGLDIGVRGGVRCSARLETSVPGVYAAGDMCEYESSIHDGPVRIEHEEVAMGQGAHAARNMLGAGAPYEEIPYFWSDLADWLTLEAVGAPVGWDEEVERDGVVLQLRQGRVVGAATIGGDLDEARRLIAARATLPA